MNENILHNIIDNKKVLILGFGKEGRSTYQFLRQYFPDKLFWIADNDKALTENYLFHPNEKLSFILGDTYLNSLSDYDLIIKTPGISLKNLPNLQLQNLNITSQTELFLQLFSKQVIGITGTKGKSTTSNLIYSILKSYTNNVVLVGNMGFPPFDQVANIDNNSFIVFEMSSHQLENCKVAPHFSILLNLFQEHLDHYQTYKDYQLAKFNIAKFQLTNDYFICNADNNEINVTLKELQIAAKHICFSLLQEVKYGCFVKNNMIYYKDDKSCVAYYDINLPRNLKGEHNLLNIMAAINVCKLIGIPDNLIIDGIGNFKGLEHRIEYVGNFDGVNYYNDSISTIPEATIAAVNALKSVNTLLLGGFDRGIEYSKLAEFLAQSSICNLIFIGEAGKRILSEIMKFECLNKFLFEANSFEQAVEIAIHKTEKAKICLLSPAAASYDMFKNFEERGNRFKELVSKSKLYR
ncbi:MAG: UDP-N-acetylmuramoyl-L-alanine--D-glutamate ligase [Bacteroidetes bacterium]|nr:UDP-N-acetylmuramoyl-L-alanine--D-glutamate ligase [Bacteroidota bacterium]